MKETFNWALADLVQVWLDQGATREEIIVALEAQATRLETEVAK